MGRQARLEHSYGQHSATNPHQSGGNEKTQTPFKKGGVVKPAEKMSKGKKC
jgi:hypothetical protein